jgi:chromosome segregation ATPase
MTDTLGAVMTEIDARCSLMKEWQREHYRKIKVDIAKTHVHLDRWLKSSRNGTKSHESAVESRQDYDARMVHLLLQLNVPMLKNSYLAEPKRPYKDPVREADIPISRGMLMEFREETRSDMRRVDARFDSMDARFNGIDKRLDGIDARLDGIDARLDGIDARLDGIDARLDGIEARFAQIDARFAQIDARFDQMDAKFAQVLAKLDAHMHENRAIMHQTRLLVEDQNKKNLLTLDQMNNYEVKHEDLKERVDYLEKDWADVKRALKDPAP